MKYFFILCLLFCSCTHKIKIGQKLHTYNAFPERIIWLQLPGLDEEHLILLKIRSQGFQAQSSLEQAVCWGKTWQYNLQELRPSSHQRFFSQMTGRSHFTNSCDDLAQPFIWNYLAKENYKLRLREVGVSPNESLQESWRACDQSLPFMSEQRALQDSVATKEFVLIRDYEYLHFLQKNQLKKAQIKLEEVDQLIKSFLGKKNQLILVTSARPYQFQFPSQGSDWKNFEKKTKTKNISLMAPVFAFGARAENFCGLYHDSSVLEKILKGTK